MCRERVKLSQRRHYCSQKEQLRGREPDTAMPEGVKRLLNKELPFVAGEYAHKCRSKKMNLKVKSTWWIKGNAGERGQGVTSEISSANSGWLYKRGVIGEWGPVAGYKPAGFRMSFVCLPPWLQRQWQSSRRCNPSRPWASARGQPGDRSEQRSERRTAHVKLLLWFLCQIGFWLVYATHQGWLQVIHMKHYYYYYE